MRAWQDEHIRGSGIGHIETNGWQVECAVFLKQRLDELFDEPRPGAPRKITDEDGQPMVTLTLETAPADAIHWSTRSMARRCGLSRSTINRIWKAFALQPHRTETFPDTSGSADPLFIEKVGDLVCQSDQEATAPWCSP